MLPQHWALPGLKRMEVSVTETADTRILEGRRIAKSYAGWAAGAGLVPVPFLDVAGLMTTQLAMLRSLTKLYGVPFNRERAKVVLSAAAGSLAPQGAASMTGLSGLKALPGWGGLLGMTVMPALAVASTMAVADWFINHLIAGGTLADAEPGPRHATTPNPPVQTAEPAATPVMPLSTEGAISDPLRSTEASGTPSKSALSEGSSGPEITAEQSRTRRAPRPSRNDKSGADV